MQREVHNDKHTRTIFESTGEPMQWLANIDAKLQFAHGSVRFTWADVGTNRAVVPVIILPFSARTVLLCAAGGQEGESIGQKINKSSVASRTSRVHVTTAGPKK